MTEDKRALIHASGEGEENNAFALKRWFRVTPAETGGAFCVFEEEIPEGSGPPLHIHKTEHELFTVLSGRVRFHCEGEESIAGPGTTVLISPGAAHAFKGIGPGPARVTIMLTPGHGEGFFRAVEERALHAPDDMAEISKVAEEYGVEFIGPPLD